MIKVESAVGFLEVDSALQTKKSSLKDKPRFASRLDETGPLQTPKKSKDPLLTVDTNEYKDRARSDSGKKPWVISAAMSDARSNSGLNKTELRAKNAALTNKTGKSKFT